MKGKWCLWQLAPVYLLVLSVFFAATIGGNRAVTVISQNAPIAGRTCIIIDPGHGGEDGGATSCTGVLESTINLQISQRLDDLFHLLGYDTYMIRREDVSVYTQGKTIAQKKVSDLKERVRIVNDMENAILVSIHQNYFSDSRYSGAQVFYGDTAGSDVLALQLQKDLITYLDPVSNRKAKKAQGIYLMEHSNKTGVLIECGFLSNPQEEAKLLSNDYQKNLCCVIVSTLAAFANT